MSEKRVSAAVRELRSPQTIRLRCQRVLEAGLRGELAHFAVDLTRLAEAARLTAEVTRERYPSLQIPAHSRFPHFDAGGVPRLAGLMREIAARDRREQARALVDVVVTSVLLDAGAGASWRYREPHTGLSIGRSEGLAVASLAWAQEGGLSSHGRAYEVDAGGLSAVTAEQLARAFQVSEDNPLVGVEGRVHLMRALGAALAERPDVFGRDARIGGLVDHLASQAQGGVLRAETILLTLLDSLASIWPGRLTLDGEALGDVWAHPQAGGEGETQGLLPLHKLSQWLTYSLLHPLEVAGLEVRELAALTGLAEYRNGGLFLDLGVLTLKDPAAHTATHEVSSELVVEWRALTVALLDRIAPLVCQELGATLSLPSVLEGGTWAAGRKVAQQRRSDGGPPLSIRSDGTVF
ncbi:MAG: putative pyrimidine-degrading protein [Myxococcaceae bacterium]|nr:putative pyrimidine-degrading protein [Myxococcaceae bacterium]